MRTKPNELRKTRLLGALAHAGIAAVLFSALFTGLRLCNQWVDAGTIVFNSRIVFSAVFWFFGGAIIGYLSWRNRRKQEAERDSETVP